MASTAAGLRAFQSKVTTALSPKKRTPKAILDIASDAIMQKIGSNDAILNEGSQSAEIEEYFTSLRVTKEEGYKLLAECRKKVCQIFLELQKFPLMK